MRKIYEGETLSQALLKMQIDMGKDAIIVGHKKIKKGGILGFFGSTVYQVIALKPKNPADDKKEKKQHPRRNGAQPAAQQPQTGAQKKQHDDLNNKNKILEMLANQPRPNAAKDNANQNAKLNMVIDDAAAPEYGDITAASVAPVSKTRNIIIQPKNPYVANKTNFGVNQYRNVAGQSSQNAKSAVQPESAKREPALQNKLSQPDNTDYDSKLNAEIQQLKKEIKLISANMAKMIEKTEISETDKIKYPGKLSEAYIRLIENEIDENIAERLINNVKNELTEEEYNNLSLVRKLLEKQIIELFPKTGEINFETITTPYLMTLVGTTGVGKTTTIAKLGANFSLVYGRSVGFITIDTYRLAAVEQLQKYAEILETPLKVIFKAEDFKGALNELKSKEIIFVDTAGRSPKDVEQMYELKEFVRNADASMDVCLVIQATTKYRDIEDIINKFGDIGFMKIIITKIDETLTFGPIVNIIDKYKLPIIYVTTGQDVPDDIEAFDPAKLAKAIIYPEERNM